MGRRKKQWVSSPVSIGIFWTGRVVHVVVYLLVVYVVVVLYVAVVYVEAVYIEVVCIVVAYVLVEVVLLVVAYVVAVVGGGDGVERGLSMNICVCKDE